MILPEAVFFAGLRQDSEKTPLSASPQEWQRASVMRREDTPPGEDFQIRCRRLGHDIPFSYCRKENKGHPCFKIIDCWYEHFLVEDHLRKELDPDEWDRLFEGPPKPKLLSLVELIEQARKDKDENGYE